MEETPDDLVALQALLEASSAAARPHLARVITADRRLSAAELCARLSGMSLLALATVTADGRPLIGPVDGIFYRGAFYFGSAPDAVRIGHIRMRPQVSATHLPGEHLAVTAHGRATVIDVADPAHAGLRRTLLDIYVPRFGPGWEDVMAGSVYARIDADRLFTFHLDETPGPDPAEGA